jgi:hypothetical protein
MFSESIFLVANNVSKVERALTLCSNNDYDFVTNKLIPKPNPSHPTKQLSSNMFAFIAVFVLKITCSLK